MLKRFPRLLLKENRKALSMEEARMWIKLAVERNKLALFGLYAFEEWKDGEPILSSVVLDCIALRGEKKTLEKLGSKFLKKGKESLLLFDGESFLLITEHDGTPLEKVKEPLGTTLIKDVLFKFTYPMTYNGNTGKLSRIIKRFRLEK